MNIQKSFVAFLVALFGWCSQPHAQVQETRVALVIGNSNYKNSPLKNPVNDARDMASKLRGLGFTVIERNNLVVKQIGSTLREFRSKLTPGSVALVYYAGHGLQIKGDNYFPTVDADIAGEEDVPNQSLAMRQIMDVLGDAKTRLNLVFLDACRNNPYSRSFRSGSEGLSKVNAPTGTLISFATRPGSVAADGVGRNGLYTGALLEAMAISGQPIEQVLKRVVTSVKAGSKNQQEPWMEGSIEGEFCFGGCAILSATSVNIELNNIELSLWESAKDSNSVAEFQAYLSQFPNGYFAEMARAKISSIIAAQQQTAEANKKMNEERLATEQKQKSTQSKSGWTTVTTNSNGTFYINDLNLKRSGDIRNVWTLLDYKTSQRAISGKEFLSTRTNMEVDCQKVMVKILAFTMHSGSMLSGEVIDNQVVARNWQVIPPDTSLVNIREFACRN